MKRNEARQIDALDRYWDAAQRDKTAQRPADIDDFAAAVIRRLDATPSLPRMPQVQDRTRTRVLAQARLEREERLETATAVAADPRLADRTGSWQRPGIRWAAAHLATAALVVLTLGLGVLTLGPWREVRDTVLAHLPRAEDAAPGPGEVTEETLLEVSIPAAYFPAWDLSYVALALHGIPPGNTSTWTTPGLRLEYLVDGAYRVRSDGPSQVMRRGESAFEDVAPGAETAMSPGDTLLAPATTQSTYVTGDETEALILNWMVVEDPDYRPAKPDNWISYHFDLRHDLRLQSGAVRLQLERIGLGPDATVTPSIDALELLVPTRKLWSPISQRSDNSRRNMGTEPVSLYSASMTPVGRGTLMP